MWVQVNLSSVLQRSLKWRVTVTTLPYESIRGVEELLKVSAASRCQGARFLLTQSEPRGKKTQFILLFMQKIFKAWLSSGSEVDKQNGAGPQAGLRPAVRSKRALLRRTDRFSSWQSSLAAY